MRSTRSGLFLMEMIWVILFFSFSAAICLQLFSYSSRKAEDAENLSYATLAARSAAACYQATGGDLSRVGEILSATVEGDTLQVGYDNHWQRGQGETTYELQLIQTGGVAEIVVTELGEDAPIYTLTAMVSGGDTP